MGGVDGRGDGRGVDGWMGGVDGRWMGGVTRNLD